MADTGPKVKEILDAISKLNTSLVAIGKQTHAGAVMVAAAVLDQTLEQAITTKFVHLNSDMRKRLYGERGPVGTFSAKIDLGFALGLFDSDTYKRLSAIRQVRNLFAHTAQSLSFDNEEVREELVKAPGVSASEASITAFLAVVKAVFESVARHADTPLTPALDPKSKEA